MTSITAKIKKIIIDTDKPKVTPIFKLKKAPENNPIKELIKILSLNSNNPSPNIVIKILKNKAKTKKIKK